MVQIIKTGNFSFICEDELEVWRVKTLFTKEVGTIRWLNTECQPNDIFYDIGANIGLYTTFAASKIGPTGLVYAFEPHIANAHSLLLNININNLENVTIITSALHDQNGFFKFNYLSKRSGSSGSQLGHTHGEDNTEFIPTFTELKYSSTIDKLIKDNIIKPPNLIKIDVDGNELKILHGMNELLNLSPPRSIQVEIHPNQHNEIIKYMSKFGYNLIEKHFTSKGQKLIINGANPEHLIYNAIFKSN